jgi:Methyl-CpG binding domain
MMKSGPGIPPLRPLVAGSSLAASSGMLATRLLPTAQPGQTPSSSTVEGLVVRSSGGGGGNSNSNLPKLPDGWRRTLVQKRSSGRTGTRYEVCLHTPTGERLRTKEELADYAKRHNLKNITEDILHFKSPVTAQVILKRPNNGDGGAVIQRTGPTVFRPGPVVASGGDAGGSGGLRTVKMVVRNPMANQVILPARDASRSRSTR